MAKLIDTRNNLFIMTPERAGLIGLMHSYLSLTADYKMSLLEIHQLMYFYEESDEKNLRVLRFNKNDQGLYSDNLQFVLVALEGCFIKGYDKQNRPNNMIELKEGAIERAIAYFKNDLRAKCRFEKVSDLIERFEIISRITLLSKVHWLIKYEGFKSIEEITEANYKWNRQKRRIFTKEQVSIVIQALQEMGWV